MHPLSHRHVHFSTVHQPLAAGLSPPLHPSCVLAQVPSAVTDSKGATLLTHDLFTNDVLYAETVLDMTGVPGRLLPLIPLFCRSLTQVGRGAGCVCVCVEGGGGGGAACQGRCRVGCPLSLQI
jgi:hypothetical protein